MFKGNEKNPLSRKDFLQQATLGLRKLIQDAVLEPLISIKGLAEKTETKVVACIEITNCTAYRGSGCSLCYQACPLKETAIEMVENLPQVIASGCTGCNLCVPACPEPEAIFLHSIDTAGV